ncbi:hypothetical protein BN2476_500192 [Paraburkholderia piptadeniae]|uniref:Uncharacterized protein n=1 Tax=Paraburkholderia piptadeniae TaxID=1701573 RepID=A0A1N7SG61_9BURK|nr:hypothetical protein BN2476_500192 [Paraburkholderia piptadeniae]
MTSLTRHALPNATVYVAACARHDFAAVRNAKPLQGCLFVTVVSEPRRALRSDKLSGLLRSEQLRACKGACTVQERARAKTQRIDAREALTHERARQRKRERR